MSEQTTQTYVVKGMHCASCVAFLEENLVGKEGVRSVKVNLRTCTAVVSGDLSDNPSMLAEKLTGYVSGNGYQLTLEDDQTDRKRYREFLVAVPAALVLIAAFLLLQEVGLVNVVTTGNVTYGTALFIGIIASVSTCLAVVGGLVLSISANAAKEQGRWQSQALFHGGRLIGFFILGGVIGALSQLFQLSIVGTSVLGLVVALVMFMLGVNLLDVVPGLGRLLPRMPRMFARKAKETSQSRYTIAPFLVGVATFFLPCGFTQSMQVYTLTTGSFWAGGLTMLLFALGTFPVLAALSFGAFEIAHKPWKGTFFKAAGIIVITLAVVNAWNAISILFSW